MDASQTPVRSKPLVEWVAAAADLVAAAIFSVIFVAIVAQTMMRYVFRSPLSTSLELASLAFIWLIFWAAACNLSLKDHVTFDIVYDSVSERTKRVFMVICNVLYLLIFLYALPDTWGYFLFLETQFTASLAITYQIAFFTYFVFAVIFPLRLAVNVVRLLRPGWQESV